MLSNFLFLAMLLMMAMLSSFCYSKCEFQAIFNFGDSNSDTGGYSAAFPGQTSPFGMTYFKRPTGRISDGRLIIDFLAQALGLPFLSPYLQSIGSDYKHGANYATSASTVILPNTTLFSPFSLGIQLNQMKQFKAKVEEFHSSAAAASSSSSFSSGANKLPSPDIFGKSLYTIYIGQNDFTSNVGSNQFYPQVVYPIAYTIKELYKLGGRTFLVLNLAPVGCYPAFLAQVNHSSSDLDMYGCMVRYNNAVVDYNKVLKEALAQTRGDLKDASLIHVDTHSILLDLFQHPKSHGLQYGTKACCGNGGAPYNFNTQLYCGNSKVINGDIVSAKPCDDPYNYVSWDGYHNTEAANKLVAKAILKKSSYFDPPFPLHKLCDLNPID